MFITASISLPAIRANLRLLKDTVGPHVKICPALKANCYGHGVDIIWETIAETADAFCVATPDEALHLRSLGWQGPLLVFFFPHAFTEKARNEQIDAMLADNIILTVAAENEIKTIAARAERMHKRAEVHLEIDSGMGRAGCIPRNVPPLLEAIRSRPVIMLTGVYTHFAAADTDLNHTFHQLSDFLEIVRGNSFPAPITLHAANSAAAIAVPAARLRMIRPGIAVYGYQPIPDAVEKLPLQPALRLTAPLLQIKRIRAGSATGYGLTYKFTRNAVIGRVPIGYGDGYPRSLSNKASVRIKGHTAPLRGRVSMDQIVVELTDIPDVQPGDEVEIISPDPAAVNSVENLAGLAGTIPYEITCRIGGPRVRFVKDRNPLARGK